MNIHAVYHSSDNDGFASGAIIAQHIRKTHGITVNLIPYNYGQDFPWADIHPTDIVYMADVSLQPYTDMERLAHACKRLVWLDHHKSAINAVDARGWGINGIQHTAYAGCELTWVYFNATIERVDANPRLIPWYIRLLGRYDVWDQSDKRKWDDEILPFQYWMKAQSDTRPPTSKSPHNVWNVLASLNTPESIANAQREFFMAGQYIRQYEDRQLEIALASYGYDVMLDGMRTLVCNRGGASSKLFDTAKSGYDLYAAYVVTAQGYRVTLYTPRDDVDCSDIARQHGGGGHRGAAGFLCQTLPWATSLE